LNNDVKNVLRFLVGFLGLIAILAVASAGAYWYFSHHPPQPHHHAAPSAPVQVAFLSLNSDFAVVAASIALSSPASC
jgi:hypothetical protein